ncbi:VTT domain-containing protein [Actibacterium sp. MT2.3-13A]|uniref:TVP38/TMEM64 family protein n=1 Tax=Actibacterium sp. MT2.3-13A TaxID=2828332 RepID=UPI002013153B|nr:VTT domain-containing protein [Actibacterium sp. MT2.3-13A]
MKPLGGRFKARRGLLLVLALSALAGGLWWAGLGTRLDAVLDQGTVSDWVVRSGAFGPALIILLMAVAVVASPLPSAPIALAAGAAYGHVAGTVYVILGAELGALIAFGLARRLGREALRRRLGNRVEAGLLGSQNALMLTVFASRLLPFVSFDMISYAAGLSGLRMWRFALATLAGIVPASFLLAHLGGEAARGDWAGAGWAALGLGAATLLPLLIVTLRDTRKRRRDRQARPHPRQGPHRP